VTAAELAAARRFVAAARWSFAKTMPDNPHHWVKGGDGFEEFVAFVRAHGVKRLYRGYRYKAITLDGFAYWLTWGGGPIVNRKLAVEAGWEDGGTDGR
jgi:hypothetical protein